jgi:MFS transporter, DHA2 family, multidrug resistance protein
VLVQHLTPENPIFTERLQQVTQYLIGTGSSAADAADKALGLVSGTAARQAAFLGAQDCFRMLGWFSFALIVLALLTKPYRSAAPAEGH